MNKTLSATNTIKNVLAIETATNACSVAVSHDSESATRFEVGNNLHSNVLLGMVSSVLAELSMSVSDLELVAVGQGPGSFTGLRIGIGVAQGLAYGAACRMMGVSSLAALAHHGLETRPYKNDPMLIMSGIDARMNEIYLAEYVVKEGVLVQDGATQVVSPEQVFIEDATKSQEKVFLVGNAWHEYSASLSSSVLEYAELIDEVIYPSAAHILALVMTDSKINPAFSESCVLPQSFYPVYIRNNVANKSKV